MSNWEPEGPPYRLRYLGDPILTTPAEPVESHKVALKYTSVPAWANVADGLVTAMRRIVAEHRALGLAANQVGSRQRVAIIAVPVASGDTHTAFEHLVAINPRLVAVSDEANVDREGCLSIPGFTTTISRATVVTLEYEDEAFRTHRIVLAGLYARCAQHEIDHLNGRLIVDGLSRQQRRQAQRLVHDHLVAEVR